MLESWEDLRVLRSGLMLSVPDRTERQRLAISSGTRSAPASLHYEPGSKVPSGTWRELEPAERDILFARAESGEAVRLVCLAPGVRRELEPLRFAARHSDINEVRRRVATPAIAEALGACLIHIRSQFGLRATAAGSMAGGIRVNPPNLATVTTYPGSEEFVGMHVDNWSRTPLSARSRSPRRISINVGDDPRYFLFLNLPIGRLFAGAPSDSMADRYGTTFDASTLRRLDQTGAGTAIARAFMSYSPHYPVIRLKVNPCEAYISSTESVVHDGSSMGVRGFDVSLSFREG
jgi:hypothetical protein